MIRTDCFTDVFDGFGFEVSEVVDLGGVFFDFRQHLFLACSVEVPLAVVSDIFAAEVLCSISHGVLLLRR